MNKHLQSIYDQYYPLYKNGQLIFTEDDFLELVSTVRNEAYLKYKLIKEPKTTSLENYIKVMIRQKVSYDYAKKSVIKTNAYLKVASLEKYFKAVPIGTYEDLSIEIFNADRNIRSRIWKDRNTSIIEMDKLFKAVCEEKNAFAKSKGYTNLIDLNLAQRHIPKKRCEEFIERIDRIVEYCNANLSDKEKLPSWFYSEFNIPCLLCEIKDFPFTTPNDVLEFVVEQYPIIQKFREKINIIDSDSYAMEYIPETDSINVLINKNDNSRHQTIGLLHELSHTINVLYDLQESKDPYSKPTFKREEEEIQTEMNLRMKISNDVYNSFYLESLVLFWKTIFQIEMFNNPRANASLLNAKIFNRVFKEAKQKQNILYVLDQGYIMRPLSKLPHAIATYKYLSKCVQK